MLLDGKHTYKIIFSAWIEHLAWHSAEPLKHQSVILQRQGGGTSLKKPTPLRRVCTTAVIIVAWHNPNIFIKFVFGRIVSNHFQDCGRIRTNDVKLGHRKDIENAVTIAKPKRGLNKNFQTIIIIMKCKKLYQGGAHTYELSKWLDNIGKIRKSTEMSFIFKNPWGEWSEK